MNTGKTKKIVATFATTSDAIQAETLCKEAGVEGRLIPTPSDISAGCGLAFMMPPSEEPRFCAAIEGHLTPEGYFERMLRG